MASLKKTQSAKELLAEDHAALDRLLKTLLAALDKAEPQAIFERLDLFWARLAMHIRAENLHLFPAILNQLEEAAPRANQSAAAATDQAIDQAIAQLRTDHDFFMHELAAAIKTMRKLKDVGHLSDHPQSLNDVRASIATISKRLESHNELEEKLVYRLPAKVLTPNELRILTAGVERELQNLPPRFHDAQSGGR